jgi:hypothetical protein
MKNRIAEYLPTAWFRRGSGSAGAGQTGGSGLKAWTEPIEQFVTKHPGASLAVAFAAGVAIAWWLKRK